MLQNRPDGGQEPPDPRGRALREALVRASVYDETPVLAEIITIGDELCRGEIVDTNSAWLADKLWEMDITCAFMGSCRDVEEDMRSALTLAASRADLIITSGGLGPTLDDRTVDVLSALANTSPVIDEEAKSKMDARIKRAKYVAKNMDRQVRVPSGSRVYKNSAGLAPGFEVPVDGTPVFCLPGIPRELKSIYREGMKARIVELREATGGRVERLAKRVYRSFGRGESQIAELVAGVDEGVEGVTIGFQVKFPETWVKFVVRAEEQAEADERLATIDARVRERLQPYLYGIDQESLAQVVGGALKDLELSIVTAESCTGGMIGSALTDIPGSSAYFLGGAVTYSNAEKTRQLAVPQALIEEHGAVSEEVVVAMSKGAQKASGADVAVAVSGVAGPGGGSEEKPVGTVWLAVAYRDQCQTRKVFWPGTRDQVRKMATHAALAQVLRVIRG